MRFLIGFDLIEKGLDKLRIAGTEGCFGVADVKVDGLDGFAHDIGEILANWQVTTSGHHLHQSGDLVFHVLVDRVGQTAVAADEVDVLDDGGDVVADEFGSWGFGAAGVFPGLVVFIEEAVQVTDEGEISDRAEHLVAGELNFLGFGDVDVFGVGILQDAADHRSDVLVDWENMAVDGQMLVVVDAKTIFSEVKNGGVVAIDFVVEFADGFFELLSVLAGVLDDVLQWGVLFHFNEDRTFLLFEKIGIVFLLDEAVFHRVPDGDVVMDEGG